MHASSDPVALRRTLGPIQLTLLGVGAIIGYGRRQARRAAPPAALEIPRPGAPPVLSLIPA